jgi:hypothetical protein
MLIKIGQTGKFDKDIGLIPGSKKLDHRLAR